MTRDSPGTSSEGECREAAILGTASPDAVAIVRLDPADDAHVAAARALFLEYAGSLGVDLAYQGFEDEMTRFPADYLPPDGGLRVAVRDGAALGCVAFRRLGSGVCEMKRLYVRPADRGLGLGRRLAETILADAREAGHARMRLDTLPSMAQARALYATLGFREIEPYYDTPIEGTVFLERGLGDAAAGMP